MGPLEFKVCHDQWGLGWSQVIKLSYGQRNRLGYGPMFDMDKPTHSHGATCTRVLFNSYNYGPLWPGLTGPGGPRLISSQPEVSLTLDL